MGRPVTEFTVKGYTTNVPQGDGNTLNQDDAQAALEMANGLLQYGTMHESNFVIDPISGDFMLSGMDLYQAGNVRFGFSGTITDLDGDGALTKADVQRLFSGVFMKHIFDISAEQPNIQVPVGTGAITESKPQPVLVFSTKLFATAQTQEE